MNHDNLRNSDWWVEEQLQLQRQHLNEWQIIIALEIENQFALNEKFRQEISQHPAVINFRVQAALTTQHMVELETQKQINRQKRAFVKERQTQEKAQLDDDIANRINNATDNNKF